MDLDGPNLPFYPAPSASDIISVEADPDLQVTSLIPIHSQPQPGWGVWPDVSNDDRVSYMEKLIADHLPFTKDLWHGGITSEPLITTLKNDEDQPKAKKTKPEAPPKNAYNKEDIKEKKTVRKQRCISSYFHAAASSSTSEDKILELLSTISDQVSKLQKESKLLHKLLKCKKTTISFKRSAFNTLLGEGLVKKGNTTFAHKGCQTEPTNINVPVSSHDVCQTEPKADFSHHTSQAPMEEDHNHSPVVSQYAAQLYGSTSHSNSTTGEPVHASPVHTSPIHNPQTPSSPINVSPVHVSTTQNPPVDSPPVHNSTLNTPPYAPNPTTPPSLRLVPPFTMLVPTQIAPKPLLLTPSLSQPKYDTSCNQSSQRRIFPLSPLHLTPELDSLPGFVGHATAINAFSATATSKPSSVPNTKPYSLLRCAVW
ncbi:hypothetical protein Bca52824_088582 [Brassica carinata]|uniref:Uncharacterized protein n=1 Tax=Brassica carinata TaxID=52824 RepID=A0A8X7TPC2_BRACI|nr:hypothetical protein Bca52824_088582 [Brassica carinata]